MSSSQMDFKNRLLCYSLRNPAPGTKRMTLRAIVAQKLVRKTDGSVPSKTAINDAARSMTKEKQQRGRREGWRKTTKQQDKTLLATFHRLRPKGHYVDSRMVHAALPRTLRTQVQRRTVRRRLAEQGYVPTRKTNKSDPGPALRKRRVDFAKAHEGKTPAQWRQELQAVGDFKDFTWYPKELRPKFRQLRASWTYMKPSEKFKPEFVRPKRWFKTSEYKKTKKQKVFGCTTSTGESLAFLCPMPLTTEIWAGLVKTKLGPFLKRQFPGRASSQILLDGERLLHAPPAKAAMTSQSITVLPGWPKYSPDINPQENVWKGAEVGLRKLEDEDGDESFEAFQKNVLKAVKSVPGSANLISSMARRMKEVIEAQGAMIRS